MFFVIFGDICEIQLSARGIEGTWGQHLNSESNGDMSGLRLYFYVGGQGLIRHNFKSKFLENPWYFINFAINWTTFLEAKAEKMKNKIFLFGTNNSQIWYWHDDNLPD